MVPVSTARVSANKKSQNLRNDSQKLLPNMLSVPKVWDIVVFLSL